MRFVAFKIGICKIHPRSHRELFDPGRIGRWNLSEDCAVIFFLSKLGAVKPEEESPDDHIQPYQPGT